MPGPVISVSDIGQLALPSVQLFNDTFDTGILDTQNRWLPTPTVTTAVGSATINGGTIANGTSQLQSQFVFRPTEPGFLLKVARINIEFPVLTTAYRFWGFGLMQPVPTAANAMLQGIGFEIRTDGKLYAVTYQTGNRVQLADLSVQTGTKAQPQDGAAHKYYIYFRGDLAFWAIDDQANVVASYSTGASGPDVNQLPIQQVVVSNGGSAATIVLNGITISDTTRTTTAIGDGSLGYRKMTVTPQGFAVVQMGAPAPIGLINPAGGVDTLRTDGAGRLNESSEDLMRTLIREVRVTNRLLLLGLNIDADLDANTDTDYD